MKVISINTNGIRAAARKGFFDWLKKVDADVVCIQETKAQEHQLEDEIFYPKGYHCHYFDAEKKRLQRRCDLQQATARQNHHRFGLSGS